MIVRLMWYNFSDRLLLNPLVTVQSILQHSTLITFNFPVPGLLYLPPFFIISEIFKIFDYVESINGELF